MKVGDLVELSAIGKKGIWHTSDIHECRYGLLISVEEWEGNTIHRIRWFHKDGNTLEHVSSLSRNYIKKLNKTKTSIV